MFCRLVAFSIFIASHFSHLGDIHFSIFALLLLCDERDFMVSLSDDMQPDIIDAFNTSSRYSGDVLNINNVYFDNMIGQIQ